MRSVRKPISSLLLVVVWMTTFGVAGLLTATAQQPQGEETTRHLRDTAFIDQGNKAANKRPARRSG